MLSSRTSADMRTSEIQTRFAHERIINVEKNFGDLCTQFAAYASKVAKLRDEGDELARTILACAESENLNRTMRIGLTDFANSFGAVQDYRQAQVQRIEAKVVSELSLYGAICKHAKDELKISSNAMMRELSQRERLEKVRERQPSGWRQISQAENEFHKAFTEASKSMKLLEQQMDEFEKRKLADLKKIFLDFVSIEMLFHARALEMYTRAYNDIYSIDEEKDLEQFRNGMRMPATSSRLDTIRSSMSLSLDRLPATTPGSHSSGVTRMHRLSRTSSRSTPSLRRHTTTSPVHVISNQASRDNEDQTDDDEEEEEEEEEDRAAIRPRSIHRKTR